MFQRVQCKRALAPSGLPHIDYALNPYGGCEHRCVYCYAPEVTHQPWETWSIIRVKVNVAYRLSKELPGLTGVIGIGTVTDPYQAAEKRFGLTRDCLNVLRSKEFPVHIHTKSDLILRDIGILSEMDAIVGVTVTNVDDRVSKIIEPGAPLPGRRIRTLSALVAAGIDCYALIEPVMDHLRGKETEFAHVIASTGVRKALIGPVNMRPALSARLGCMGYASSQQTVDSVGEALRAKNIITENAL